MISIDTETLRELVRASSAANDAVNDAVDALNRIRIHSDWGCKEKNQINEYTAGNINKIRRLQENSASFLSALSAVSNNFEAEENSISDMFSSVEAILGQVFSNNAAPAKTVSVNGIVSHFETPEGIHESIPSMAPSASELFNNIPVCGFPDTVSIFEDSGEVNK